MIDHELDDLALQLATTMVDEEISKHPEFAPNRDRLLLNKTSLLKTELLENNSLLQKDLKRASVLIDEYQLMSDLSLPPPLENETTLQKKYGIPSTTLQKIYSQAIELQKKEAHADASALLKFLIVLNPDISDFWLALGFSQTCLENYNLGLKSFDQSIELKPDNFQAYYLSAYTYNLLNDTKDALAQVEKALQFKESPSYPEWEPTFQEIKVILTNKELV